MKARLQIPVQKNLRKIGAALAVVLFVVGVVVYTQSVSAATAVLVPNTDVTTDWNQCNAGTCTNDHATYIDEDIASPTDSDYIGTGGPGVSGASAAVEFGLTTTANVDSVSSVNIGIRARSQTNANGGTLDSLSVQLRINGSLETAQTITPAYSLSSWTNYNLTFNGTWTQANLDGAQILITRNTLGSGNPTNQQDDVRISALSATVTYTSTVTFDQSAYRWFEDDGNASSTFAKSWGGDGVDIVNATVLDDAGNIYTVGSTNSTGLTAGGNDQILVKYNSAGVEQWSKTWGGTGSDSANAVALDTSGNIYVAGYSNSSGLTSGGDDQTLVKYNSSGVELWSKTWGGDGSDVAKGIVINTSNFVYVAGSTNSTGLTAGGNDQTLVKYSSSGVRQWAKTWGGDGEDSANAVALDTSGDIYIAGQTASTGLTAGGNDQTLVKVSSLGFEQWSKTWGGTGTDIANALTLDDDDNIYVAGHTASTGLTSGSNDQTLVKYNSSGVEQWSKTWGGGGSDGARGLTLDTADNIYVAGYTDSTGLTAGSNDQTLVKYNSSGVEQWSKTWGGDSIDLANAVALDLSGNIYVAGYTSSTGMTSGSIDHTLLKFNSLGTIVDCTECVDRTTSEVDRSTAEVDRSTSVTDRSTAEVDRTTAEVDRTDDATITVVCDVPGVDVGTPLAATNASATSPGLGVPFRLRMTVHVNTAQADPASADFKLQYAQRGADNVCDTSFTNETYADLSPSSGAIRYYNNPNTVDGQALITNVNDPSHGTDDIVHQAFVESNNFTIANAIPAGDDGLWDFSLYNHSATVGTSWCFRAVTSTGVTLASYVTIPEISVPVPSATQANYRWFENADSVTPGTVLAAQDTAATVAAETPVRLRQRIAVDSGGMVQNYQNYKLQYGEKVTTCSVASYDDVNSGDAVTDATLATSGSQDFSGDVAWSGSFTTLYAVGGTSGISVPAGQNQSTHTVTLTGFGFSIPTAATVTGVEVSANSSTVAFDTGGTANMIVGLNGVAGSSSKNQSLSSGGSQTIVLGGSTDLFGASSISPSAINQSTFGITARLSASADLAAVLNTQIYVDYFSVKIYYTIPSGAIQYHDNATPADGATISSTANDPTNSGRTAIYQTYRESDPFSNPTAIPAGQDGIWDFAFTSTSAADGKTYCFRVVESDDTPLNSYTYYPEITFGSGGGNGPNDPPTLDQSTRGGGGVVNGVKKNLSWRN